ncbi:hypothetical protein I3843_16G049100 [Carya illinoinensis]|nr:hypothetical protein I3843_16G049100 [Carya illinoinensis]
MGKVQKNPMRSDTEAFPLGRRVHIITLTEYFIVASFIEFLLYPFLRRTILRVTDEDLLPRQSVVQYVKGLAYSPLMLGLLAILATIAFILRDSLELFNKSSCICLDQRLIEGVCNLFG